MAIVLSLLIVVTFARSWRLPAGHAAKNLSLEARDRETLNHFPRDVALSLK
jgi:hypothetical protein